MSAPSKNENLLFLWSKSNGDYLNPRNFAKGTIVFNNDLKVKYNSIMRFIPLDFLDIHHKLITVYLNSFLYENFFKQLTIQDWDFIHNNIWAQKAVLSIYHTICFINRYPVKITNIGMITRIEKNIKKIPFKCFGFYDGTRSERYIQYNRTRNISLEDLNNRIIPYPDHSGGHYLINAMDNVQIKPITFKLTNLSSFKQIGKECLRDLDPKLGIDNLYRRHMKVSGKTLTVKTLTEFIESSIDFPPYLLIDMFDNNLVNDKLKPLLEQAIILRS